MKITVPRLLSVPLLLLGLNSCVGPAIGPGYSSGPYGGGYGGGGGYSSGGYGDEDVCYYDSYGHYSAVYLPGYTRTYVRYDQYGHRDRYGYYDRHGRDTRSHDYSSHVVHRDDHRDDHHDDHRSSSSGGGGSTLYRHVNSDNNRGAPQGEHSKEWFQQHGYSTARLAPAGSQSKKKKDDDDDKHHHH